MIRIDRLRGWVESQATRARPWIGAQAARIRALLAIVLPWLRQAIRTAKAHLRQAAEVAKTRLGPIISALEPHAGRAREALPRTLSSTLDGARPTAARWAGAVRHQIEAAGDARATPRQLRDRRGRRLRSSAYAFGPDGPRHGRHRARTGLPHVAGTVVPAALKIGLVVMIAGLGFLVSSSAYINYAADLPDAHTITSQPLDEDSLIYAADGTLLADLHPKNEPQHYYESLDQMGKWLPLATVAVEDSGFWSEPGIDVLAMGRAAWIDWRSKQPVQGASTITQQLVKLRLTGNKPSLDRKIREAVLAIQVEHTYTKRQILEQYLDSVDYSNNTRGSLAAARVYFHVDTKDLDLAQAAMLAGIPQSPLYNNPFTSWDQAKRRQLIVLDAMVRTGKISPEQADEAYAEDLTPPDHMFLPTRQIVQAKSFVDWVVSQLSSTYGTHAVEGGGLHVVTTLNIQVQKEAEQAVTDQVNYGRFRYGESQGAMTAIDPRTGAVVAMVGSAGLSSTGGEYDFAYYPPRNPGSSMKIYTYTAAIESGKYTMATMIPDTPVTIAMTPPEPNYSPKNYDGGSHGTLQLQQAMGNSYNVPAVKVEMTLGVPRVVDMARRMGAPPYVAHQQEDGSLTYTQDDPPSVFGPSLTLGGYGESPLQMATGASVIAAQGVYHPPFGIASISTSDGTVIAKADPAKGARQVLDPKVAYIMAQIMSNDDNRVRAFGRGSPLTLPGRRVGAKTGTSENWRDGWTLGYTPSLASAFWFGNSDYTPMHQGADGVYTAAPAWHAFMLSALDTLNTSTSEWYTEPPGLGHATVGGEPVWLLPGTSANQPMPPLPPGTSSSAAPATPNNPNNPNNPGRGQGN